MSMLNSLSGGLLSNNMWFVFQTCNDNLLTENHTKSLANSLLIWYCKSGRLMLEQNIVVSSANNTNVSRFDTLQYCYVIDVKKKKNLTQY